MAILHVAKEEREKNTKNFYGSRRNMRERGNVEKLAETFTPEEKPVTKLFLNR